MNIQLWLKQAEQELTKADIPIAHLDVLVLAEDCLSKDRAWLLAHPEFELNNSQLKTLQARIERRKKHEPIAYIRNKTQFYGREFYIDHHVLEPRPESETMIELLEHKLTVPKNSQWTIIDIGTGSGALAITAKLESPASEVMATDIDKNCLAIARKNAKQHATTVRLLQGDLLEPLRGIEYKKRNLILLCNLPYVPDNWQLNAAAMTEPKLAIFGGPDGLDIYRSLFKQLRNSALRPHFILTEALPSQHERLAKIALTADFSLRTSDDFIQCFVPI